MAYSRGSAYDPTPLATPTVPGEMSATDKAKLDGITQATDAKLLPRSGVQKIIAGAFADAAPADFVAPDQATARLSLPGGSPATVVALVVPAITDGFKATVGVRITWWKQTDVAVIATADWVVDVRNAAGVFSLVGTATNTGGSIVKDGTPAGWTTNITLHAGGTGLDVTVLAGADATYGRIQTWVSQQVQLS